MELWIRSQDREKLLLVKELYVFSNEPMTNKTYKIINNYNENLGIYETKERALEVLDEIQNILRPKLKIVQTDDMSLPIMNGEWVNSIREKMEFDTIQLSTYVYEMPKD